MRGHRAIASGMAFLALCIWASAGLRAADPESAASPPPEETVVPLPEGPACPVEPLPDFYCTGFDWCAPEHFSLEVLGGAYFATTLGPRGRPGRPGVRNRFVAAKRVLDTRPL